MRVLLAASEVAPIIKLGGLGDVVGSLPKALQSLGVNIDVIVPFFPVAKTKGFDISKTMDLSVPFGGEEYGIEVFQTNIPVENTEGVDLFLLKHPQVFSTGGKDAFANSLSETEMFMFFDKAVVEYVKARYGMYDVVHCNDWHTGLITHLLSDELGLERPATVFTIHNIAYQGIGDDDLVSHVGLVPGAHPTLDWDIADGDVNLAQQGITSSDFINTVSKAYAKEFMTPEFGCGFEDILKSREARVRGILNGIDYSQYPRNYDMDTYPSEKPALKEKLQEKLGLKTENKPIFSFISRLDPNQKGLDILYEAIPNILKNGGQFVLLGTGDEDWQKKFADLKGDLSVNIMFDVKLAMEIYQGSDFFIIPSKYEPCGLTQMMSMWYGTLPVVNAVGGLKDTVRDEENGFSFSEYSVEALSEALGRAFSVYKDAKKLDQMIKNAMNENFSWEKSAQEYKVLYEEAIASRK